MDGGIFRKDVFFTNKTVDFWMVLFCGWVLWMVLVFSFVGRCFAILFSEMELELELR